MDSAIPGIKKIFIAVIFRRVPYICASLFLFIALTCLLTIVPSHKTAASSLEQLFELAEVPGPYRNQFLLMEAVNKGNRLAVETLIATGTDVNMVFFGAQTPLRAAVEAGHEEMVTVLLRRGANPNMGDSQGVTPLHTAVRKKKIVLVSRLIEAGADVNAITRNGDTPLFDAVRNKNVDAVRTLLDHGADIAARDANGQTILRIAINTRDAQIAQLLIERGANTNEIDPMGHNLLTYSVKTGDGALVRLFAARGFDVNKPDKRGRLPLSVAAKINNGDTVRTLIKLGADIRTLDRHATDSIIRNTRNWNEAPAGFMEALAALQLKTAVIGRDGNTPLHNAAFAGQAELVVALLDAGADPNARRDGGMTPLHVAAHEGHVAVAEILLDHGAKLNETDNSGYTALHTAVLANRLEIVKFLLRHKADMEKPNKTFEAGTALFIACGSGHTEIARALLVAGANPNAPANWGGGGSTPIFNTIHAGRLPLVKLLLEHGADVNFPNTNGVTPLVYATCNVSTDRKEIIQNLLDHGSDPRRIGKYGSSALGCAAAAGNNDLVRLLHRKGAEPNARINDHSDTPLMLAVKNGRVSTVPLLLQHGADLNQVRIVAPGKYESALDLAHARKNPEVINMLKSAGAKLAADLPKPIAPMAPTTGPSNATTHKLTPKEGLQLELKVNSSFGKIERVKELLRKGAKADSGALNSAARSGKEDVIRLLVQHGADPNAPDPFFKRTPLMETVTFGYLGAAEALLELGAKPDAIGDLASGELPLVNAIIWKRPAIVEVLLKKGADPNVKLTTASLGNDGDSLLIQAVRRRNSELVSLLTKYRANSNYQDRYGRTALHHAVSMGDENIVRILLESGARMDIPDKEGNTPLALVVGRKNENLLALFLKDRTPTADRRTSQRAITPAVLKTAIMSGNAVVVRELLRHGADPNVRDPITGHPLLLALQTASTQSSEIARLLVEHGADPNLVQADGSSALFLSIERSYDDLAMVLLRKGADPLLTNDNGESPLSLAIRRGRFELVKLMRDRGVSLDIQDARGWTSLMRLAQGGDIAGVTKLLELGANPDVMSRQRDTALSLAVRNGKPDIVRLLASRSKAVDSLSSQGHTALHEAIMAGKSDIVQILLKAGAGINLPTREGLTPLMLAARTNKYDQAKLLLEAGADMQARSRYQVTPHDHSLARYTGSGKTALMYAVTSNSIELVNLLLKHGALVNVQDDEGNTVLILAAGAKPELIQMLIKADAKPDMRNKMGFSAADYAKMMGRNTNIVTSGVPDPRFSTPEKTWELYLASLRQGDRQTALLCLISRARDEFGPFIKETSKQELNRMGNAIKSLRITSRFGEFTEAMAVTHEGHAGIITFENRDGEWKINEM